MSDLQQELKIKDEMIEELRNVIRGTITEIGSLQYGKWEINYSSILTKLIQEAGRWCEQYASDLFILWNCNLEVPLTNGIIETKTLVFAFRESGVDGNSWYENHKDESSYYRAIWFLDVVVNDGKITMTLHRQENAK